MMPAALLLPGRLVAATLSPSLVSRLQASWQPKWESVRDEVRGTRLAEDAEDERRVLRRFMRLAAELLAEFNPATMVEGLRSGLDLGLRDLVERETREKKPERAFALKQLSRALDTFGVLTEYLRDAARSLPANVDLSWLPKLLARDDLPVDHATAVLFRWELSLFVSFDLLDDPSLDDFCYWAHRAVVGARQVEALLLAGSAFQLRGDLARLRAREAWTGWDAEDVRLETAPWPTPRA